AQGPRPGRTAVQRAGAGALRAAAHALQPGDDGLDGRLRAAVPGRPAGAALAAQRRPAPGRPPPCAQVAVRAPGPGAGRRPAGTGPGMSLGRLRGRRRARFAPAGLRRNHALCSQVIVTIIRGNFLSEREALPCGSVTRCSPPWRWVSGLVRPRPPTRWWSTPRVSTS